MTTNNTNYDKYQFIKKSQIDNTVYLIKNPALRGRILYSHDTLYGALIFFGFRY